MNGKAVKTVIRGLMVGMLLATPLGSTAAAAAADVETQAERDARMSWWREARFGMFIHWGLYAIPAGSWRGEPVDGIGEWIMDRANIPVSEYEKLAERFHPVRFDPEAWVRIAKDAGMKYMVITSKHHDGFCLFDSKVTAYDAVDATPHGKDLLKPLAEECRKQGLRFCVYYSIMDWHHPAQDRGSPDHYNPTRIHAGRKADYLTYMTRQLEELLALCDPDVLWFDGEWPAWYTAADGHAVYAHLRQLKPQIIVNNRVGSGRQGMDGLDKGDRRYAGDFGTPEQQIPATGLPGVDWESCMTMNDSWGYKRDDHNWKDAKTLIRNLVDIASKGGNYLLNVGPTAEGEIPDPSVERLRQIGQWMHVNGTAIYGTQASPLGLLPWGRCTRKEHGERTSLYLHVFDWPADGKLAVSVPKGNIERAYLLADPDQSPLRTEPAAAGLVVRVPATPPDPISAVVVLEMGGTPRIAPAGASPGGR